MRPTIGITPDALTSIRAIITGSDSTLETGGALFGHEHALLVTSASGPGPNAVHQSGYFLRDLEHTQLAADRAHKVDRSQWIGEWHTHPSGPPEPSPLDLNTYVSHLVDPELRFERFIALIGSLNPWPHLSAWVLVHSQDRIELHRAALTLAANDRCTRDEMTPDQDTE
ncbi:Mov34/MPN/PAD-1 family protein [Microbacterium horticulturae]|uniref:Mov34/MPN/PAD-1 family protein n=1 Tax=Microbacterium horticulturae TaxID=3028316 RepID=A0ABY8C028_9MICO|nr:Mov34/MPN/PAD-1 family protein [Microbacterium sp. KACC 23027]WEG09477.1 Mov34/MPN/PAD-1 family protein [Microbacterium sp. KACC 23027]